MKNIINAIVRLVIYLYDQYGTNENKLKTCYPHAEKTTHVFGLKDRTQGLLNVTGQNYIMLIPKYDVAKNEMILHYVQTTPAHLLQMRDRARSIRSIFTDTVQKVGDVTKKIMNDIKPV